jgi:hypothetical protein
MRAMIDKLLETLRAWHSDEKGRHYTVALLANCDGMSGRIVLMRGNPGSEQTDQSIPFRVPVNQGVPEVWERILRLIVELQQEAEA